MLWRPKLKLLSVVIVLFWLVMMGLFARREGLLVFLGGPKKTVAPRLLQPSDTWMGIYLADDERIGFVNTTSTPESRDGQAGANMTVTSKLRLSLLSVVTEIVIVGNAWITMEEGIREFDLKVRSAGHSMRVVGAVRDGVLDTVIHTAGEDLSFQFPVGEELLLAGDMGATTLNLPELEVGEEVLVDTFDPMTFSVGKARVKCIGEEQLEVSGVLVDTKIVTTEMNGITSKAWLDFNEEVIRVETPFGFSLRKISPNEALRPLGQGMSTGLVELAAVHPTGKDVFRGARRMSLRFGGVGEDHLPPTDATQTADSGLYTITMAEEPAGAGAGPPAGEYLQGDGLVQVGHARIVERAAEIVGKETDPWLKAQRVYGWVFNNITKVPVFSIPSAIEVLESGEGDCNEHTILFTALARAAGVPTRIAIGVVWSDELDGFYYHAWPEVLIGEWIWMDPTLGQPIADATHIKLLNGSIDKWPRLIPYLGQLQIDVVSIE
ncbi:MAG: hypothetical protein GWP08_06755 [Nitrospiraceae bacterium]|nr:hypothetical protein [Nitrospiraceae bacterium]